MSIVKKQPYSTIDSNSPLAISSFSNMLLAHLNEHYDASYGDIVIVCIGTDRSTGDCLGPLIGHKISNLLKRYPSVHVFGTLEDPVHAKNLNEKMTAIKKNFHRPFIIAIDACLGKLDRVGYLSIHDGPLKPGAGVNKDLPEIGDMHITGIVNIGGFMEYVVLQNTRLNLVMKMAHVVSNALQFSMWKTFNSPSYQLAKNDIEPSMNHSRNKKILR